LSAPPTLLTRTYAGIEKGKVQAFNDFPVFDTVTLSSFASGVMLSGAGWIMVQIAVQRTTAGCKM
jgi:hypothetical protein